MQRLRLRARGLVFDARTAGPPAGELVVLLHGFPQTASCWARVTETLAAAAESGRRAIRTLREVRKGGG